MDASALRETFRRDGIVVLDGVLSGSALESFREQVSRELTKPCIPPESGTPEGVRLSSPETWPRGSQRRVIEVVPPGVGEHWGALAASPKLRHALDALLGEDAWELPNNQPHGGPCAIRHWYCPVVFPETSERGATSSDASLAEKGNWRRGDVGKGAPPWSPEEDEVLYASRAKDWPWERVAAAVAAACGHARTPKQCRERHQPPWTAKDDAALLELCAKHKDGAWQQITNKMQPSRACTKRQVRERAAELAFSARGDKDEDEDEDEDDTRKEKTALRWVPVNRRRVRGKGWHVDIGPGFDTDAARHVHGDPCQGCVALVLLSDWREGGGGTAYVAGSHQWVGSFLRSRAPLGVRHQELNAWAIDTVTEAAKTGRLPLRYRVDETEATRSIHSANDANDANARLGVVDQIVGAAGSVALLHPWLVHSGTTNLSRDPRLMANGMVRVKREAFERDGCVAVLRDLPSWNSFAETKTFEPFVALDKKRKKNADAKTNGASLTDDDGKEKDVSVSDAERTTRRFSVSFEDALASARAAAGKAAAARRAAVDEEANADLSLRAKKKKKETPLVSVVVPAHDAARWLDECFASVVAQTYPFSRLEVSAYDDASSDDTETIMRAWAVVFSELGVKVAVSGSRWGAADADARANVKPGGIGHGKNVAVRRSRGEVLVFLDADDIMTPRRVETQVAVLLENKHAIVGGSWARYPAGSTEHYERWANTLSDPAGLWLEQFRETTVQMPTWCMLRSVYDAVGGFDEVPPDRGEGEDLVFFHKHIDAFCDAHGDAPLAVEAGKKKKEPGEAGDEGGSPATRPLPLRRAGAAGAAPLLLYRWSPDSGTSRVSRQRLLEIRVAAFTRRVLSKPAWRAFAVWGAGRDAKAFANALDASARRRIVAMLDVDRNKCGRTYANHRWREEDTDETNEERADVHMPSTKGDPSRFEIPVTHFEDHAAGERARRAKEKDAFRATPVVVCVAKRRKGAGEAGDLERNVETLGLEEGNTLWYFM